MTKARKKVNGLTRRSSFAQSITLLIVLVATLIWRNTVDLSETERATLAPAQPQKLILEHLNLAVVSAAIVLTLAIPIGIILTRKPFRRLSTPAMVLASIGQAAPTMSSVAPFALWPDFGYKVVLASLVVYAFLSVLKNTMVGLRAVDPKLVEAARGMGMLSPTILAKAELSPAVLVMFAGIRTALVLLVGSVTLVTFVKGDGLGSLITTEVNPNLTRVLVFGSLLVTVLVFAVDWAAHVVGFVFHPKGL